MSIQTDFTTDEWSLLRETPNAVGLAVAVSGSSGFSGSLKEAWTAASAVLEGAESDNPLVRAVADKEQATAGQKALTTTLKSGERAQVKQRVQDLAAEYAQRTMGLLRGRDAASADAYKRYLEGIAQRVSQAAKEGGFLFFGGERVGADEQAMLDRIHASLE